MRKNKWISLIVSVLLITSVVFAFSFGGNLFAAKVLNTGVTSADTSYEAAQDELKQDVVFVSGTAGVDATELKAEKEEQNPEDDFIVTAIGRNLNTSKKITTAGEEVKEESTVPETKPADVEDPEKVPFDISEPEIFESGEVEYADNQILIKFVKSFDGNVDKELKDAGVGKLEPMFETETGNWYVAYLLKDTDINETMETVRAMNKVVVAEYNFKSEPASIDTDPISEAVTSNEMADQQWVLKSCGIQAAWDYLEDNGISAGGSSSVTVAVIDTGVDYNHQDLAHNIWVNNDEIPDNGVDDDENGYVDDYYGVDMTSKNGSGMDDHGHGTHVAGIIAAENNDIGVVGIAYNTKVMPIKAGDASGYFLQSNIAEAIIYAYSEGADVINMSFGGGASSVAVRDALETAYSRCVLVAAAGNNGAPNEATYYYPVPAPNYPGDYKFVLGVMSSDINDVESGFSNWDANKFNNNEYEVYAPGNDIMSTIPGDRYASLSGTSMASPVVAAQAALLRSMFNDPDTYPTKFIYGQISGTSENTVSCCNPQRHLLHNIPGRVNYINSFTNMPKPEISVSDYTIFDTAGFTADTDGIAAEAAEVNNGDGIIDNGEVVALGFTLRNRWGMSKDTVVSINATNDLGVTNPYVTMLNNDVNYGSVGTYSEQDAGRIIDNDKWTGWEKPFYLKIADNCPNDYTITLNVSINSKNGLDESDTTTYGGSGKIVLVVRNGVILPNKITEDMTLTSDNYYIIPNSTIIMEGATVTVEPGTKIQFWTADPKDSYADNAITYLKVMGKFLCKGTEENPIELFPSDLMGQYRVEIYKSDKGFVSLVHTNVTNPYLQIDRAYNCTFSQKYRGEYIKNRYLSGGTVQDGSGNGNISINDAKYCVFYKMSQHYSLGSTYGGAYSNCIFVDSAIDYSAYLKGNAFIDCVFYGNNDVNDGSSAYSGVSSYTMDTSNKMSIINNSLFYHPDQDRYYVRSMVYNSSTTDTRERFSNKLVKVLPAFDMFAKRMGGGMACINSDEEYSYIVNHLSSYTDHWLGSHKNGDGDSVNYDNSAIPESVPVTAGGMYYGCLRDGKITFESNNSCAGNYCLLEVPGNGLAFDIKLDKYVVYLETSEKHQINASIRPFTVNQTDLIFTSDDESIATVDANGLITAVSAGTTNIKVYSQDMAIYNYVTVNVSDYVALEGLSAAEKEMQVNIGEPKKIKPVFTPSNTTRKAIEYTSSDENIATVSSDGTVTALTEGYATITLTGENDLTAQVEVHAVVPAQSIKFSRDYYETNVDILPVGHQIEELPEVPPTCTETGLTAGSRCSVCGEVLTEQKEIPALGHSWDEGDVTKAPTCEEDGEKLFTCAVCGATKTESIGKLGHNWGDWTLTTPPTNESAGLETRTCTNDPGHVEERTVPNLNHVHNLVKVAAKAPTCTSDGNIEYWTCRNCNIDFSDANGANEILGSVTVKATGHSDEVVPGKAPTCTESGLTEGIKCSVCNEVLKEQEEIPAAGHLWNEGVITRGATCEEDGEKLFTCDTCGVTKTETIEKTGHDWEDWSFIKEPTADEEGTQVRYCWDDHHHKEVRTVAKLDHTHDLVHVDAVPATCTESGSEEYWTCTKCYKNFSDAEGINEIKDEDSVVTKPEILPLDTTNKTLIWESTNPDICTVERGKLLCKAEGIVTLRATVQNTDLSDEITVIITDKDIKSTAVKTVKCDNNYVYAITEGGEIYVWGNGFTRPTKMAYENVEDAYLFNYYSYTAVYILDKEGNVSKYTWDINNPVKDESFGTLRNIKSLGSSNYVLDSYHAIDNSGNVWAWGNNDNGKLGDGSEVTRNIPVQIEFENKIVKILEISGASVYLDVNGNMYGSGGSTTRYKDPVQIASGVSDIYSSGIESIFYSESGNQISSWQNSSFYVYQTVNKEYDSERGFLNYSGSPFYHIDNGIPYVKGDNNYGSLGVGNTSKVNTYTPMVGVLDAKDIIFFQNNSTFVITNDGTLYGTGYNDKGRLGIGTTENVSSPTVVDFFSRDYSKDPLAMTDWNGSDSVITSNGTIEIEFNMPLKAGNDYSLISLINITEDSEEGNPVAISKSIDMNKLVIKVKDESLLEYSDLAYTLTIPKTALSTLLGGPLVENLTLSFLGFHDPQTEDIGDSGNEQDDSEVVHSIVTDEEKIAQRKTVTNESLRAAWEEFTGLNINACFYSNVILNRLNDDNVSGWLRVTAPDSESYQTINLGYNYWGTTNEELINKQILDFDDYQSLADIDESNYLTEAPTDTFPFVTQAYLTVNGGKVDTVGNEEVTFVVDFNRAMDTSIPLDVKFGSSYPYAEYTIEGEYVSDTEWQGTVTLTTLIENGYQYFSISNGKAAGTSLQLYKDWGRFPFKIDTASAQSLLMQGTATEQGIELTWTQDDFETLAGYNVYRSDAEDGLYQRVNKTVIPADTKYLLDDTVEPGVKYYYNFTVVQSDMTESEPSGKVQVTSLDTMAPNIYHTPVATAYKGSNLVISATIIDNVGIETATLYYREAGTTEWKTRTMDANNDKYSAVVNSSYITDAGLEYYIEAFDGIEYTYKGSAEEPFFVMVQEAFSASDLGDVDGNGFVELKDAMMLLMAVNDRLNLTEEQFRRADLDGNGELSAKEALKIINYINGTISSLN